MVNTSVDRSCPRCGGNIIIDRDYHGWYEQCLQCSFMKDLKIIYQKKADSATAEKDHREPVEII